MSVYINDKLSFVKQSVESILNQSYRYFDFYIQQDGVLQDDVDRYLDFISGKDSRVKIFKRSQNRGLAYSLNELLCYVLSLDYVYIARMDADDISLKDRFKSQIQYLNGYNTIDCLGTCAIEIDEYGVEFFKKNMPMSHENCYHFFMKRDCLIHPTVMFRRSYFDKAGLYPEDTYFGEDTMMWAKGFKAGCKFGNLQEYYLQFRLDKNFFERRRGWRHAYSIFLLRCKVNKMLNFGLKAYINALLYAIVKMMPKSILYIIYKLAR